MTKTKADETKDIETIGQYELHPGADADGKETGSWVLVRDGRTVGEYSTHAEAVRMARS